MPLRGKVNRHWTREWTTDNFMYYFHRHQQRNLDTACFKGLGADPLMKAAFHQQKK